MLSRQILGRVIGNSSIVLTDAAIQPPIFDRRRPGRTTHAGCNFSLRTQVQAGVRPASLLRRPPHCMSLGACPGCSTGSPPDNTAPHAVVANGGPAKIPLN